MVDQDFSAKNLRQIFDLENRRGNYLEKKYFPEMENLSSNISRNKSLIKRSYKIIAKLKNKLLVKPSVVISKRIATLELSIHIRYKEIKDIKSKKEGVIKATFENLSSSILTKKADTTLKKVKLLSGKTAFQINDSAESYFTLKNTQKNISEVFGCYQPDRSQLISQVKQALSDAYPKIIFKTDINSFFESVSREKLLAIIRNESTLSTKTREVIQEILKSYSSLSTFTDGLPRGVAISPVLAELYLRGFDEELKSFSDVLFYARYVDDIFIIFDRARLNRGEKADYLKLIESSLGKLDLTVNLIKTSINDVPDPSFSFDYLGYKFEFNENSLSLDLSANRK